MAGLKKQKKEKSTSPNVVLVIFLVFFFLLSIGLGIWGYYGYAGQEELRRARSNADAAARGSKLGLEYYSMLYGDLRLDLGDTIDPAEEDQFNTARDAFLLPDFGKFKDEKTKEAAKKLMDDLKDQLAKTGKAKTDFRKELKAAQDEAKEWKGRTAAELAKNERMEELTKRLTAKQDEFFENAKKTIEEDSAAQLKIVKEQSKNFIQATEQNKQLTAELKEEEEKRGKMEEDHARAMKALNKKLEALRNELAAAGGAAPNPGRGAGHFFPLLLDISMGKPLWDQPVGKITRVDLDLRQVAINLGSAQGAKPELTFNIFGANAAGRAEKQLKGSIEIIKVVDASTSLARITSLYDSEGREILMNLQTRGRILRESEAPIREGDLLFNLFWGARVAVAGYVSITGEPSDSPAEQNRQMEDFMHLLRNNGMQVDAYVDLRDGQIRGNITAKTRYLIRGAPLRVAADAKAPAAKAPDGDKEKEPAKEPAPNTDRNDLINKSSRTLENDARDRGVLLISAENFATVIGYRRARSANSLEISTFRPSLPGESVKKADN
jgi:hypothetical protein